MKSSLLFFTLIVLLGYGQILKAQDLSEILDSEFPEEKQYTFATFKGTRISIGQSVETRKAGTLEILAHNRFWNSPKETSNAFVADKVNIRFGLEYGITDNLTAGLGISTFDGFSDGFLKYRLLHQTSNTNDNLFSITLFQSAIYRSKQFKFIPRTDIIDRFSFTSQLLIARKFTRNFSLQIAPSYIHHGAVGDPRDPHNQFAIGIGARYKLGRHVAIATEYYFLANEIEAEEIFGPSFGPFSIGVNWELSDLYLQFMLTNSRYLTEDAIITQNRLNFNFRDGNLHFGVNATYIIHFKKSTPHK